MHSESKTQKIAVTGATGRVGSHLVEILEQRGHDVVPIARSKGVDVVSGEGLDEALAGAETIIDTATGPSPDQEEATDPLPSDGCPNDRLPFVLRVRWHTHLRSICRRRATGVERMSDADR